MSVIDNKFNEWRLLLQKYQGQELEKLLWRMGCVIAAMDQARLFPKVLEGITQLDNGGIVFPTRKPIDVDDLIRECDGIMVDGFIANYVDSNDPEIMVVVVEKGLLYTFRKSDVSQISLGGWETKLKDIDGVERTVMFYKRIPVELDDLPHKS